MESGGDAYLRPRARSEAALQGAGGATLGADDTSMRRGDRFATDVLVRPMANVGKVREDLAEDDNDNLLGSEEEQADLGLYPQEDDRNQDEIGRGSYICEATEHSTIDVDRRKRRGEGAEEKE